MKKKSFIIISGSVFAILIIAILFATIFFKKVHGGINIENQIELGNKYLQELKYEEAIVAYNAVIAIEPLNQEATKGLVQAYEANGEKEKILGLYSMQCSVEPTDETIQLLVDAEGEQRAFTALENTIMELENSGINSDKYVQNTVNQYIENDNLEDLNKIVQIYEENGINSSFAQSIPLWTELADKDLQEIMQQITSNEDFDHLMPELDENDEVYIGKFDQEGKRTGLGICYYGSAIMSDSRIYIGNFEKGVRSGEGIAYSTADYYIICSWSNDLANGQAEKHMYGDVSYGELKDGHISAPTKRYKEDGELMYICGVPDTRFESGYGYVNKENYREEDLMDDPCPGGHVYCWDCQSQKAEEEE